MEITVNAPAKINLYLNILSKRDDGYHNVEMVMQSVSLFDKVTISKALHSHINLKSNYNFPGIIQKNTAYMAAQAFFEHTNINNQGINIYIEKNIPTCAGLAGGSADAAAVLVALNDLFSCNISKRDLALIGEKVGADVPFCLVGGTVLATGIGTSLLPLANIPDCYIVIVKPNVFVSTKEAYKLSDEIPFGKKVSVNEIISAIYKRDIFEISASLYNRFEKVMSLCENDKIKSLLKEHGAINSCMTGTGSAVFGIFNDEKSAASAKNILKKIYKEVFLVNPLKTGCYITKE